MIEKAMSFLFPDGIVPWCNGNTSDFGSDISSSSLDGITKRKRLSNEFRQPLFLICASNLYSSGKSITSA